MTAFATANDVRARWPAAPGDTDMLDALLTDAAVVLRSMFRIPASPDDAAIGVLRMVSVSMVKRALVADNREYVSAVQNTAGPFSQSQTFRNPEGNLYVTGQEREMIDNVLGKTAGMVTIEATGW